MTKVKLQQFLYTSETNIIGMISNGLVHKTPKSVVLKQIKAETARISRLLGLNRAETNYLWGMSYRYYNQVSKKVFSKLAKIGYKKINELGYNETLKLRQNAVYEAVQKQIIYKGDLEKEKNELVRSVEHRIKHDGLFHPVTGLIATNRAEEDYSPFFLASSHAHPAKDHARYEGKFYYDADYASYMKNPGEVARIGKIISRRKMTSVQEVTAAPVWLVTRPNCKHYLIPVAIDEVAGSSEKSLLKARNMYMPDEIPLSYEKRQYRAYYDRLKVLEKLKTISPSDKLDEDIKNTRNLVKLWAAKASRASLDQ